MFCSIPDVLSQTFWHDSCHHGIPGKSNARAQVCGRKRINGSGDAQAKRAAPLERPLTFCALRVSVGQLYPT
jgi:hypothetical protein